MLALLRTQCLISRLITFHHLCLLVLAICYDAIRQVNTHAKGTCKHLTQQVDIVLLKILVHERARYA